LLDISMAGIDGDVCRRVKEDDNAGLRLIAMSAPVSAAVEAGIVAAGAERVLKKPFTPEDLLEACGAIGTKT
jgi:CheY-like chemotaxis protein